MALVAASFGKSHVKATLRRPDLLEDVDSAQKASKLHNVPDPQKHQKGKQSRIKEVNIYKKNDVGQ